MIEKVNINRNYVYSYNWWRRKSDLQKMNYVRSKVKIEIGVDYEISVLRDRKGRYK